MQLISSGISSLLSEPFFKKFDMSEKVRAKKHLGQHFLNDENIARKIVESLTLKDYKNVIEVGPGMGVLSKYLFDLKDHEVTLIDIDKESIEYLKNKYPSKADAVKYGDFLKEDINPFLGEKAAVIGNFPYNISSQILFKVLEHRNQVVECVGMFQKEVAQRVASAPRSKDYGILSVLLQAFYNIEYLFTVHENVFTPPPKVKSGVIRLRRNEVQDLGCDEALFFKVVKTGFNQRRKTLRNALKSLNMPGFKSDEPMLAKRAEELTVADFVYLTNLAQK